VERNLMILRQAIGPIFRGMVTVTIPISVLSCLVGLILAVVLIIMRYSKIGLFRFISKSIVWLIRGIPMLVLLYFLFFGLAEFNILLSSWTTAIIAFSLFEAAFMSEAIRGVLQAVDQGQWEAGLSLGLPKMHVFRRIIIPQAIPPVIPTLIGYFISAIKMTSLVSNIGLSDMLLEGSQFIDYYYAPFIVYTLLSFFYLLLFTILTFIQRKAYQYFNNEREDLLAKFLRG
jgi:His/Glu/Gln/Arg/opine family amino acid ABC transporter permease subunit